MLVGLVSSLLAFSLSPGPKPMGSRSVSMAMKSSASTDALFEQLWCEDVYNPATGKAEEECNVSPYQATVEDMNADACELIGSYPAPNTGTRWACPHKMGANSEEEWVNGKLMWVHYVR